MKKIKKLIRISAYVLFISLAAIGVGINGAILPTFRRMENPEVKIEMVETKDEETDFEELEERE